MKLGIIIPFYKLSFFENCLASLAAQKDQNFTVYVGDDASQEDPSNVIEKWSDKLNLYYHRFEKNIGKKSLTTHWDRCIALSGREEYLMILGDDDILGENVVESFYREFENFQKDHSVIRFASKMIDENSKGTSEVFQHPQEEKAIDAFFRKFKGYTRSSLSEYIFQRRAYEKFGFYPYPLGWHSDDRAWLDFSGSQNIYSINEAVVHIRNSSQNISSRKDNLVEKFIATRRFYRYVLFSQLNQLDTDRKYGLINAYEYFLKKESNFKLHDWWLIAHLHLIHFRLRDFKSFIKRSFC